MNSDNTGELCKGALELNTLINLARGVEPISPWSRPEIWEQRFRDLWIAVDEEELSQKRLGRIFVGMAWVHLIDLWAYLTQPKRLNDDRWDWARDFCQQWAKVRGVTLATPKRTSVDKAIQTSRGEDDESTKSQEPLKVKAVKWEERERALLTGSDESGETAKNYRAAAKIIARDEGADTATIERETRRVREERAKKAG